MGPQPNGCGKLDDLVADVRRRAKLQWGRSRMAAERMQPLAAHPADSVGFNGAAAEWLRKAMDSCALRRICR